MVRTKFYKRHGFLRKKEIHFAYKNSGIVPLIAHWSTYGSSSFNTILYYIYVRTQKKNVKIENLEKKNQKKLFKLHWWITKKKKLIPNYKKEREKRIYLKLPSFYSFQLFHDRKKVSLYSIRKKTPLFTFYQFVLYILLHYILYIYTSWSLYTTTIVFFFKVKKSH